MRQYQECSRLLQAELGVTPEQETTDLYEQIRSGQLEHPKSSEVSPASTSRVGSPDAWLAQVLSVTRVAAFRQNLPPQSTIFIICQDELKKIAGFLDDPGCWLLTLPGPGGIGKTQWC